MGIAASRLSSAPQTRAPHRPHALTGFTGAAGCGGGGCFAVGDDSGSGATGYNPTAGTEEPQRLAHTVESEAGIELPPWRGGGSACGASHVTLYYGTPEAAARRQYVQYFPPQPCASGPHITQKAGSVASACY